MSKKIEKNIIENESNDIYNHIINIVNSNTEECKTNKKIIVKEIKLACSSKLRFYILFIYQICVIHIY